MPHIIPDSLIAVAPLGPKVMLSLVEERAAMSPASARKIAADLVARADEADAFIAAMGEGE